MIKLDVTNIQHHEIVVPYYYAWFRTDELTAILKTKGYETNPDDLRSIYIKLQKTGVPKFNRYRIVDIAPQEVAEIRQVAKYGVEHAAIATVSS